MPEPAYLTYVVKQSEYEAEPVRAVTVNKQDSSVDQSKELLKKLLIVLTPAVPAPARAPEPSPMDKLIQLLIGKLLKSHRPLRRRPNRRSWKLCFQRISGENSHQASSPDSDWYDVTGLT